MNYKIILNVLGKTMVILGAFMVLPFIVGLCYGEKLFYEFLIPISSLLIIGTILGNLKATDKTVHAKEGFFIVAFAWILLSIFGCMPFVIGKYIPNFVDAFFEIVSGFTTTGATIMNDIDFLPKGLMFWRLFTHWIGGMGVLVFVLAVIPKQSSGFMHIFRAESPGPSVGKIVSKMSDTARILYGLYILLTITEIILLLCGGMPLFDSVLYSFSSAGTGGYAITNAGLPSYNSAYIEIVIAVFMMLFATNFNVFYFLIIGKISKAFKSEEFIIYLSLIAISTITISVNLLSIYDNIFQSLRYSFFQVTSIVSTTGLTTADFDKWPELSKTIIMLLTVIGACGGSTGGGIKISRVLILLKSTYCDSKKLFYPHAVIKPKIDGEVVEENTVRNVRLYFVIWVLTVCVSTLILSFDTFGDLFTNFSATLACIGNVGPGFKGVGPMLNYSNYSIISKLTLSFTMLTGRLEIFPMLIFFFPNIWKTKKYVKN